MMNKTWNGLWTDDVRFNFKILGILVAMVVFFSFSPFGFITIYPISLTTVHILVIAAALWGGPVGGTIAGAVFGLCSMWKAEVSAISAVDLAFAPTHSPDFWDSVCLGLGTRMLFGLIAGLAFLFFWKAIKRWGINVVVPIAFVLERVHAGLVYYALYLFFKVSGMDAMRLFYDMFTFKNLTVSVFTGVCMIIAMRVFQSNALKKYYREYLEYRDKLKHRSHYDFFLVIVFNIFIVFLIAHMLERINLVFNIDGVVMSSDGYLRFLNVVVQFMVAVFAAFLINLEIRSHHYSVEELRYIESETLKSEMQAEVERKSNLAKTVFLSSMSHDIRTPMNAIIGMTKIARRNSDDKVHVQECLRKIELSGNHLLTLINDVLDISQISNGKLALNIGNVSLHESMYTLQTIMDGMAKSKQIELQFHNSADPAHIVSADELRLNQVMINIISNSVKYTKVGGRVDVWLQELPSPLGADYVRALYRVTDNGIGMSSDLLKVIYKPFTRAEDARTENIQGSGLGLSITKRLVDVMGGTIDVDSEVNKGTTFTIMLDFPLVKENAVDKEIAAVENTSFKGMRFLVAEDVEFNWDVVSELLGDYGILTELAENGEICVEKVKNSIPGYYDVVLMDVQMPIMDGYEATKAIRQLPDKQLANIPIIAMTADAFAEDVDACLDAGMDEHVSKPLSIDALLKKVKRIRASRPIVDEKGED